MNKKVLVSFSILAGGLFLATNNINSAANNGIETRGMFGGRVRQAQIQ